MFVRASPSCINSVACSASLLPEDLKMFFSGPQTAGVQMLKSAADAK
jgi:hypothetical protein